MSTQMIKRYKIGVTIILTLNILTFGACAIMSIYSMIRQHETAYGVGYFTLSILNMVSALILTELRDAIILTLEERKNKK